MNTDGFPEVVRPAEMDRLAGQVHRLVREDRHGEAITAALELLRQLHLVESRQAAALRRIVGRLSEKVCGPTDKDES